MKVSLVLGQVSKHCRPSCRQLKHAYLSGPTRQRVRLIYIGLEANFISEFFEVKIDIVGLFYLAPITSMEGPFRFHLLLSVDIPDHLRVIWLLFIFVATRFLLLGRFLCVDCGSDQGSFLGLPGGQRVSCCRETVDV